MEVNTLRKLYLEKIVSSFLKAQQLSDGNNFYFIDIHGDVEDNCDAIVKLCERVASSYITGDVFILRRFMSINMKKQIVPINCSFKGGNQVCFWLEGYEEYRNDKNIVFDLMKKIRKLNYDYVAMCIRRYEDDGMILELEFVEILTTKDK